MKHIINIGMGIVAAVTLVSCFNGENPNYQYMPNMYEPVGYETYGAYPVFPNTMEAMHPAEGSIPRGWMPYDYENTTDGLDLARVELKNPLPVTQENLDEGKQLYEIFCAVCHGDKGDGQGILAQRGKFEGVPSYGDPGRNITEGSAYHVQMFGLNAMGSYASQTNELERWQITQYVMNLKATLKGEPLAEPIETNAEANETSALEGEEIHDETPSEETNH